MSGAEGTNSARSFASTPRAWATNAPATLPQITMAAEDYNRLVRMAKAGEHLKMAVDFQARFHEQDLMAYNTIAEIPGTDLKDEIVMVGGHLDSWHSGTGATDNAIGVAAAMEAVRIIKALRLEPRRTIRIGLWAGEEQGLLGSKAYVSEHFGYYTNSAAAGPVTRLRTPKDESGTRAVAQTTSKEDNKGTNRLVRLPEYEKLSAYFNLDNGAGRIRGIHLQGNEAAGPLFRRWLEPFRDLDAATVSLSNTRGTDHTSFDAIGLPGFQFIQDPLDYNTRTHHSNQDLLERIVPEDARQAAVILASFVYNAAMLDERLPRKQD
jgi:Zn-dependent M28 family amino/carboxypeptidase